MKDIHFLSLSTYVRILENRLLTPTMQARLLDATQAEERWQLFSDLGYPHPQEPTPAGVDAALQRERQLRLDTFARRLAHPALVDLFRIPIDYHNAKVLLKGALWKEMPHRLLQSGGRFPTDPLARDLSEGTLKAYPEPFHAAIPPARRALQQQAPQRAVLYLDQACFAELTATAQTTGSGFLQEYVRLLIDSINLKTLARCARLGLSLPREPGALLIGGSVPPEELSLQRPPQLPRLFAGSPLCRAASVAAELLSSSGNSLGPLETACDAALKEFFQRGWQIPFGPEPIAAYLWTMDRQAAPLRIILGGQLAGLSRNTILERLGELNG